MSKRQSYKIGLLGLMMESGNLGCQALAYGFITILSKIVDDKDVLFELYCFEKNDVDNLKKLFSSEKLSFKSCFISSIRSVENIKNLRRLYKECDVIFDFTSGDSFSDIYGMGRFISRSIRKIMVLNVKTPLILGSQTYGPFVGKISKIVAKKIIKHSYDVVSRDSLSSKYVYELCGMMPKCTLDVAFMLPYKKTEKKSDTKRIRVGINPSGLLWSGFLDCKGTFEYKQLCIKVIQFFVGIDNVDVFLVPHVIDINSEEGDNDLVPCKELKVFFPELVPFPIFKNAFDAKNYIASMDLFIGSRMHATIGAISSGVPTIPVSYSVKFRGVFADLGYDHVVEISNQSTDKVFNDIINQFENYSYLCEDLERTLKKINRAKNELMGVYSKTLNSLLWGEESGLENDKE